MRDGSDTIQLFTDAAKFGVLDWLLFVGMLGLSLATGIYFAYQDRRDSSNVHEYLMGSRKMRTIPVAMSLIGSYVSGVTIVGTPAEIYNYGTQYSLVMFSILLSGLIVAVIYVPVYFDLQIESSYQYLELRFDRSLRVFASFLFLCDEIMFLPIVIYVPALAFSQVTGFDVYIVGSAVCIICIFYTVLGGLKAVVWTDTWQVGIMFIAIFVFAVIGVIKAGGFDVIWSAAYEGDRIEFFNFDPSPYRRHTFWTSVIGGTMYWTAFNAINRTMVQRYMSLPNLKNAKRSVYLFSFCALFVVLLCCFTGLLVFEHLGACDPKAVGALVNDDQLLPAYISLMSMNIPGALGIFVAGIFGAALSSMSVVLNSTATVILEDMIKGVAKKDPDPRTATIIARVVIVSLGLLSLALLFVVEKLGGVLSVATSLSAIAASTMFGVFTLGMLWPWANARGVFVGALCGVLLGGWVALGSQAAGALGYISPDHRVPSIAGCPKDYNTTLVWPPKNTPDPDSIFPLYRLSFNWIAPIGITTTIIIGAIVSTFTQKAHYTTLDPYLFSPVIHRFFPDHMMKNAGITLHLIKRPRNLDAQPPTAANKLLKKDSQKNTTPKSNR